MHNYTFDKGYMVHSEKKTERHPTSGKPIIHNPDGTISTEESITVQHPKLHGGRHTNINTIIEGKRVHPDKAIEHAVREHQKGAKYPNYASEREAVAAAKARSKQLGKDYEKTKRKG